MSRGGGKAKVGYAKPPEPKFIRDLKAKVGYKEPVGLDAKMRGGDGEGGFSGEMEEREDRDDEKPTIVVMKEGDLTEEEMNVVKKAETIAKEIEVVIPSDGRIMFKKPSKRENSDKESDSDIKHKKKKKEKKASSLLSFGDEEEDDS
eukprot:TRINITY_DN54133_c0_g1_i1.p1 TRINITY_DN54133_c0_g1~~TRINITY_DN54133_c0_g1_i1.p1  ORF type:complete len:147 (-),score=61.10 TRINITY_DN54133_c0_g1_i1:67-507(-)